MKKFAFADLPTELREHIWSLAIWNRECLPAAHFFKASKEAVECQSDWSEDLFTSDWDCNYCNLRSPCWDPCEPERFRWASEGNISGYVQNSGLWNACTESRQAMLRHWTKYLGESQADVYESFENYRVPDNDGDFCLVTRPSQDLCCINVAHLQHLDYSIHYLDRRTFDNFGFEFDPAWTEEFARRWDLGCCDKEEVFDKIYHREDDETTTLDHLLSHMERFKEGDEYIWLIDHRLQPTTKLSDDKVAEGGRGREVFRARDRRYIEVKRQDIEAPSTDTDNSWWTVADDCREWAVSNGVFLTNVFVFRDYLYDYLDELARFWMAKDMSPPQWRGASVKVLGCIMDQG